MKQDPNTHRYSEDEESFVKRSKPEKKSRKKNQVGAVIAVLSACLVLLIVAGVMVAVGMATGRLFTEEVQQYAAAPVPGTVAPYEMTIEYKAPETPVPVVLTPEPTPVPTPTPHIKTEDEEYAELLNEADASILNQDILNIMFIGVDYEEARTEKKWSGKSGNAFHSDVMIVCAINFTENRVDLISLPRDTYANIPGVEGIYKLNASLNCGTDGTYYGIYAEHGEGFQKVCEAAEWMLGGDIPIHYYYAVTMESVKQLIDAVDGVWYDLEGNFDNGGRYYKKGYQHMDGQACLDYMRVRKSGHGDLPTADKNRVDRQKKMLVALFESVKEKNLIAKIPAILAAFDGGLFTNCSFAQTAALAAFGMRLDPGRIGMHSMSGSTATLFHWNFTFTDQSNRVDIIEQVYGRTVRKESHYTLSYAKSYWAKLLKSRYMNNCSGLQKYVNNLLSEADEPAYEGGDDSGGDLPPAYDPFGELTGTGLLSGGTGGVSAARLSTVPHMAYEKYSSSDRALFEEFKDAYSTLKSMYSSLDKKMSSGGNAIIEQMKTTQDLAIQVAKAFGYTKVKNFTVKCYPTDTYKGSAWSYSYWTDSKFNEVSVNFN